MIYPRPPAHVEPFVRILGADRTIELLLAFGGSEIYVANRPSERSKVAGIIGIDGVAALSAGGTHLKTRVPTARPWLAACLKARGLPVAEIARRLVANDSSVRRWLASAPDAAPGAPADPRQLPLL